MKSVISALVLAGLLSGCLPPRPEGAPWATTSTKTEEKKEAKKADENKVDEKPAAKTPPVTAESVTDSNTQKIIQDMEAEMKHEAANPPKVVVPARK